MKRASALAAVTALALVGAGCGDSPEDQARDDGQQAGEAVRALYDANSADQAASAVKDIRAARDDLDSDTRKRVASEVDTQSDALRRAADAYRRGRSATSAQDADAARADLRSAVQEIRSQASGLADQDNSIANEYWRGFVKGYDDD